MPRIHGNREGARRYGEIVILSQVCTLWLVGLGSATVLTGCSDEDEDFETFFAALPEWEQPPPEREDLTVLDPEEREMQVEIDEDGDGLPDDEPRQVMFRCERTQHDVLTNHDEILNLGGAQTAIKPGLLLQGTPFRDGVLRTIPIARSPVTLSIDLPVDDASIVVENPTSATLQEGVATLQQRALTVPGDIAAQVVYEQNEVDSLDELGIRVGAHSHYNGLFIDVDFSASFEHRREVRKHTFYTKLVQPLYTIAFADDELPLASDFFAASVTDGDLSAQEAEGNIGPDNLPVFISSVTYGRIVVFTVTSATADTANEIKTQVEVSTANFNGGGSFDLEQKTWLSNQDVKVFSLGGSANVVSNAIVTGDFQEIFTNPDATAVVPLRYVVKNLAGQRPTAALGDATQFVTEECAPLNALGWNRIGPEGVQFSHVSVNNQGEAWATGTDGAGSGGVYRFDEDLGQFVLDAEIDFRQVAVDDAGKVFAIDNAGAGIGAPGFGSIWGKSDDPEPGGSGGLWVPLIGDIAFSAIDAAGGVDWRAGVLKGPEGQLESFNNWENPTLANCTDCLATQFSLGSDEEGWFVDSEGVVWRASLPDGPGVETDPSEQRPSIKTVAAASENEVWALDDNGRDILKFDFDWELGVDPGSPWEATKATPAGETASFLDAGPNADLWIVTDTNRIFRNTP